MTALRNTLLTLRDILLIAASTLGYGLLVQAVPSFLGMDLMPNFLFVSLGIILSVGCVILPLALDKRRRGQVKRLAAAGIFAAAAMGALVCYQLFMTGEILFGCDTQFIMALMLYGILRIAVKADGAPQKIIAKKNAEESAQKDSAA